ASEGAGSRAGRWPTHCRREVGSPRGSSGRARRAFHPHGPSPASEAAGARSPASRKEGGRRMSQAQIKSLLERAASELAAGRALLEEHEGKAMPPDVERQVDAHFDEAERLKAQADRLH